MKLSLTDPLPEEGKARNRNRSPLIFPRGTFPIISIVLWEQQDTLTFLVNTITYSLGTSETN